MLADCSADWKYKRATRPVRANSDPFKCLQRESSRRARERDVTKTWPRNLDSRREISEPGDKFCCSTSVLRYQTRHCASDRDDRGAFSRSSVPGVRWIPVNGSATKSLLKWSPWRSVQDQTLKTVSRDLLYSTVNLIKLSDCLTRNSPRNYNLRHTISTLAMGLSLILTGNHDPRSAVFVSFLAKVHVYDVTLIERRTNIVSKNVKFRMCGFARTNRCDFTGLL